VTVALYLVSRGPHGNGNADSDAPGPLRTTHLRHRLNHAYSLHVAQGKDHLHERATFAQS
jgi:hypothetical protein